MRLDHKMLATTDDFLPNFSGDKVSVALHEDSPDLFRITIWGDDDFGYELELHDLGGAMQVFANLPSTITIKWLEKHGFKRA